MHEHAARPARRHSPSVRVRRRGRRRRPCWVAAALSRSPRRTKPAGQPRTNRCRHLSAGDVPPRTFGSFAGARASVGRPAAQRWRTCSAHDEGGREKRGAPDVWATLGRGRTESQEDSRQPGRRWRTAHCRTGQSVSTTTGVLSVSAARTYGQSPRPQLARAPRTRHAPAPALFMPLASDTDQVTSFPCH